MARKKVEVIPNRKGELFALFNAGKVLTDPEVKALRYKSGASI